MPRAAGRAGSGGTELAGEGLGAYTALLVPVPHPVAGCAVGHAAVGAHPVGAAHTAAVQTEAMLARAPRGGAQLLAAVLLAVAGVAHAAAAAGVTAAMAGAAGGAGAGGAVRAGVVGTTDAEGVVEAHPPTAAVVGALLLAAVGGRPLRGTRTRAIPVRGCGGCGV
jgi:hypothetical protein